MYIVNLSSMPLDKLTIYHIKERVRMENTITSRENKIIKSAVKISSSSKERKEKRLFFIEGLRLSLDALQSNIYIEKFFYTKKAREKWQESIALLKDSACQSYIIDEGISSYLSDTKTPQGIFCICRVLDKQFDLDKIGNRRLIIALENIQDPSNMGSIIRTAEALGINALMLSNDCCDIYSPKVLRGSMGGVFRMDFFKVDSFKDTICKLNHMGIKTYASVPSDSAEKITKISFSSSPSLVAIGNEGNGLKKETIDVCSQRITIPMLGRAESLNASVAASIIMWEMTRNR